MSVREEACRGPIAIIPHLGIVAFGGFLAPRLYAQIVAVAYGLLVILGLLPATQTLFGLVPIYGNDVWLHLVLGVVAGYFGFFTPAGARAERTST